MIQLAAIATAIIANQQGPTLVSEKKLEQFMASQFVESPAKEKPGYYVFKESRFDPKTLKTALKDLKVISVDRIVRKEPDGSLIAWDMNGKIVPVKVGDVPEIVRQELKVGEPVMKLVESLANFKRLGPTPSLTFNQDTDMWAIENEPKLVSGWVFLGKQNKPYVSQSFLISEWETVGKVIPIPGNSTSVNGVVFKVQSANQSLEKQRFIPNFSEANDDVEVTYSMLEVHQLPNPKAGPGIEFSLELNVDEAKYKSGFPKDSSKPHINQSSSTAVGPNVAKNEVTFYMLSNRPMKYWKEVAINRMSFVRGYLGHIPTAPKTH